MGSGQPEKVATSKDMANAVAYIALGVALVAVLLLGVYVYRQTRPVPVVKELQKAQAATAADVQDLESALQGLTVNINSIEDTLRRDRQAAVLLDLKRSIITIREARKQAPASLRPKIEALEEQLSRLVDEVASPSPKKRLEIRSIR